MPVKAKLYYGAKLFNIKITSDKSVTSFYMNRNYWITIFKKRYANILGISASQVYVSASYCTPEKCEFNFSYKNKKSAKKTPKRKRRSTKKKSSPKRKRRSTKKKSSPKRKRRSTKKKSSPKRKRRSTKRKSSPKRKRRSTKRKSYPKRKRR
jgi:hypothetical protein